MRVLQQSACEKGYRAICYMPHKTPFVDPIEGIKFPFLLWFLKNVIWYLNLKLDPFILRAIPRVPTLACLKVQIITTEHTRELRFVPFESSVLILVPWSKVSFNRKYPVFQGGCQAVLCSGDCKVRTCYLIWRRR